MIFQPQKKSPSASETEEGLMSAADKKKLNGIASGANAYTHPTYSTKSSGLYKVTVDSTGHISAATAVTKSDITALGIPASDTDTHYTSKNVVGSSTAISNTTSALTNGNVYLNSVENGVVTSAHKISGSGATTVTTDANGNIIISSTDTNTNTTYTAGTGLSLSGTTFNHSNSVTAGTAQGDASKTLTFGGTFTIPTVTYDAQGHITGKGTTKMPANPNTDTKVTNTLATTTKAYVTGTTSATTNTGTQVFDTGVYLDTTAGMLTATTFKGALSGNASTASRIVNSGDHAETASGTAANAPTTGMLFSSGLFMTQTYNDAATPIAYGNIINLAGSGTGQLLCEWSGNDNTLGHLYYRSHRDTSTGGWSSWGKVAFTTDTVSAATKATQDSAGQQINTTYIKGLSISGKTITYTKGDGTTGTITTQDTNTWRGVQDNLTSTATDQSLSANQGKVLKGLIDGKAAISHTHDDRYYTESEVDTKLNGKAAKSHGNHVPATQTANNAVFLRNDNTWQTVTPANIGAAASSHTHSAMKGATSSAAGSSGLVPAPAAGDQAKFLRADGTWQEAGGGTSGVYFGTCDTAEATKQKVVTVNGDFNLKVGAIVVVLFSNTNTTSQPTLNVNDTGAYEIYAKGYENNKKGAPSYATNQFAKCGGVKLQYTMYMFTGTFWAVMGNSSVNDTLGIYGDTAYTMYMQGAKIVTSSYFSNNIPEFKTSAYAVRNVCMGTSTTPTSDSNYGGPGSIYLVYS